MVLEENADSEHFRMHIPMHSDISVQTPRLPSSLAIVMSYVRCARRRDLPAVIVCKHSSTAGTRGPPRLFPTFPVAAVRATSRRVNTSAHGHGERQPQDACPLSLGCASTTAGIFSRFTPPSHGCNAARERRVFRSSRCKNLCN